MATVPEVQIADADQPLRRRESSWLLSGLACAAVMCWFLYADPPRQGGQLWHWFVLPVCACGLLMMEDVIGWLRGDVDVFDPIGIVGLFGVHFFFLAPLLHVRWGYWMTVVPPPPDWRPWLGGMAFLNLLGLLVYRAVRWRVVESSQSHERPRPREGWRLRPHRLRWSLLAALPLAAAVQILVYVSFGGIGAYIEAFETGRHTFVGVSRIAAVSDSFPILLLIGYVALTSWQRREPSWLELFCVICGFIFVKMLFGGLHGSRANVAIPVVWAVGMIHFGIRQVPRRLLLTGAAGLVAFAYMYGFYKSAGVEGLQESLKSSGSRATLAQHIHRPLASTLLDDFGRSDVQAYVLYRLTSRNSDYQYGLGRTYYGALVSVVPGPLWRDRPPTKVKEGTNVLYGRDMYRERALTSTQQEDRYVGMTSKVFGLAGEAMLNFGPLIVPLAFVVLGLLVGWTHCCLRRWSRRDPRRLFLPLMTCFCLNALIVDSEIILTFLEGVALFPLLIVAWSSRRLAQPDAADSRSLPQASRQLALE